MNKLSALILAFTVLLALAACSSSKSAASPAASAAASAKSADTAEFYGPGTSDVATLRSVWLWLTETKEPTYDEVCAKVGCKGVDATPDDPRENMLYVEWNASDGGLMFLQFLKDDSGTYRYFQGNVSGFSVSE